MESPLARERNASVLSGEWKGRYLRRWRQREDRARARFFPLPESQRLWFPSRLWCRRQSALAVRLNGFFFAEVTVRGTKLGAGIGIQQFSETWILRQVLKVRIVAGLEAQLRLQTQSLVQTPEGIFDVAGEAVESGQADR